jgi:hypothetical protein
VLSGRDRPLASRWSGSRTTCCSGERKGPDGQKLGRAPANARKAVEIYKSLVAAELLPDDHRNGELRITPSPPMSIVASTNQGAR